MTRNSSILTQNGRFRTATPLWIHQWLWNAQSLKQHRRGALLFLKVICQNSRSHGTKIADFDPKWALLDCNTSLNSLMALKWSPKKCPIFFQGHPSNFKVTRDKKISNFDPNWAFPDCKLTLTASMDLKWCTMLDIVWTNCAIIFLGHPSNFKVTRAEKSTIWIPIRDY